MRCNVVSVSLFAEAFAQHDARPVQIFIPARDERESIGATLRSLADQRDVDGSPRDCADVSIVVLANGCTDDTARVARAFADRFAGRLCAIDLPLDASPPNIGAIRKLMFDAAAERAMRAGLPRALLVSLDADTIVAPSWIATLHREAARSDAVAGYVTIADVETRFSAPLAELYRRFLAHGNLLACVESRIDPRAGDPPPRHGSFVAASFAVTAEAYARAGGIPEVAQFEDRLFERALLRSGARVRHSLALRSWTSARRIGRVAGGFGTLVGHLEDCAERGTEYRVPDPSAMIRYFTMRAAARRDRRDGDGVDGVEGSDGVDGFDGVDGLDGLDRLAEFETMGDVREIPIDEALARLRATLAEMDRPDAAFDERVLAR